MRKLSKDDWTWAAILVATILGVVVLIYGMRYLRDSAEPMPKQLDPPAIELPAEDNGVD